MNSDEKKLVRTAQRRGARVVQSQVHIKVFDGEELVFVLSQGSSKNHDVRMIRAAFKKRGWL